MAVTPGAEQGNPIVDIKLRPLKAQSTAATRLLAMQMPCRLLHSAWRHFRRATLSLIYWTFGAPGRIRTSDPQIRSIEV